MQILKRLVTAAVASLTVASGTALAQDQMQWVNTALRERKMPQEQYIAIGKANLAQCQINASREARTVVAERLKSCDWNAIPAFCAMQKGQAEAEGQELYKTLFTGCMAEKGWLLTKGQ